MNGRLLGIVVTLLAVSATRLASEGSVPRQLDGKDGPRQIAIVVNKNNPTKSASKAELQRIFLKKQAKWSDGSPITVLERTASDPIKTKFSDLVLEMTQAELTEYWLNLKLTRGISAPESYASARLVTRYIERAQGAVGYMWAHEVGESLKVIARLDVESDGK
ncbi:MAG: substrate-binding domain-containing protein [Planctomycetota bacterium]